MGKRVKTDRLTFKHWMIATDIARKKLTGDSIHNVNANSAVNFNHLYDDGFTPAQAARTTIRNERGERNF